MKLYLQAKHGERYSEDLFIQLAQAIGSGASGGIVAALLSTFSKARIINGMDYISSLINLE